MPGFGYAHGTWAKLVLFLRVESSSERGLFLRVETFVCRDGPRRAKRAARAAAPSSFPSPAGAEAAGGAVRCGACYAVRGWLERGAGARASLRARGPVRRVVTPCWGERRGSWARRGGTERRGQDCRSECADALHGAERPPSLRLPSRRPWRGSAKPTSPHNTPPVGGPCNSSLALFRDGRYSVLSMSAPMFRGPGSLRTKGDWINLYAAARSAAISDYGTGLPRVQSAQTSAMKSASSRPMAGSSFFGSSSRLMSGLSSRLSLLIIATRAPGASPGPAPRPSAAACRPSGRRRGP